MTASLELFLLLGAAVYLLGAGAVYLGLQRLRERPSCESNPRVSVIVPVRNEQSNLEHCLSALFNQSYAAHRYEVIVVDDGSEDATLQIAGAHLSLYPNLTVLSSTETEGRSPKKAAIETGIAASQGEIIMTTDADCRVPPKWIERMAGCFDAGVDAVTSWVVVERGEQLLSRVEALDSLALVTVGAGTIGLGRPILANGANLAFRRELFDALGGYRKHETYVSGDDDLLIQQIGRCRHRQVEFLAGRDTAVLTGANAGYLDYLRQRIRWASKAPLYPLSLRLAEAGLYFFLLALAGGLPMALAGMIVPHALAIALSIKLIADYILLRHSARHLGLGFTLPLFFLAEGIQTVTVLIAGVWGLVGVTRWKGRRYYRGRAVTKRL